MADHEEYDDIDYELIQQRASRAGYWLGMLPSHPEIEAMHSFHAPAATGMGFEQPGHFYPPQPVEVLQITFSLPLNTGVVGGIVTRVELHLPVDISFKDLFSRVCACMNLDPTQAQLGYKFTGDRKNDPPFRLSTAEELQSAFNKAVEKKRRARTKEVVIKIHKLEPRHKHRCHRGQKQGAVAPAPDVPETTIDAAQHLRQLKEHLLCARHPGQYCHINPLTLEHEYMDIYKLTHWAKKILLNEATLDKPPFCKDLDHVVKRRRHTTRPSDLLPTASPIHLHLSGLSPNRQVGFNVKLEPLAEPLADKGGQHRANVKRVNSAAFIVDLTQLSSSNNDFDVPLIAYPHISNVLQELDSVMPLHNYPQYKSALTKHGVVYANNVANTAEAFFVDHAGMPLGAVGDFIKHAKRMMRRAEKCKVEKEN